MHRGVTWVRLPFTPQWTETDSEVCAYLKSVYRHFDAEGQLVVFEMKEDAAEWQLQSMSQEEMSAAVVVGMFGRATADDHGSIPQKRITAAFVFGKDEQAAASGLGPMPVDISGLVPPPRPSAEANPTGIIAPAPLDTIEEESASTKPKSAIKKERPKFKESAETLARWIEGMSTPEEEVEMDKQSKTNKRNNQRRKAKARASEAAREEGLTDNSEGK